MKNKEELRKLEIGTRIGKRVVRECEYCGEIGLCGWLQKGVFDGYDWRCQDCDSYYEKKEELEKKKFIKKRNKFLKEKIKGGLNKKC